MSKEGSWALVAVDDDGRPAEVLMLLDERKEADEIAFELRRAGRRVLVVAFGTEEDQRPPGA